MMQRLTARELWDLVVLVFAPATVVLGLLVAMMLLQEWVQRQRGDPDDTK